MFYTAEITDCHPLFPTGRVRVPLLYQNSAYLIYIIHIVFLYSVSTYILNADVGKAISPEYIFGLILCVSGPTLNFLTQQF